VVVGDQRTTSHDTANHYHGSTASNYKAWLQSINPKTGGQPAYTSYISAKVVQQSCNGNPWVRHAHGRKA
jgi:hypothetical protein